jgi:hypothetical protein
MPSILCLAIPLPNEGDGRWMTKGGHVAPLLVRTVGSVAFGDQEHPLVAPQFAQA